MKRRLFTIWVAVCLAMGVMTVTALAGDGAGFSPENPLEVPRDAMVIVGGTYYGIAKDWFSTQNPDKTTMYFSIQIPDQVTAIAENGFRDNYTPDKKKYSAVSTNDGLGGYIVTSVDFSQAVSLRTIKSQAAMGCALSGVLDLSNTQVSVIEKSAFNGCKGLTGVILPSTLEELGTSSSGSVFNGCSGLEFVRTAGGNPSADFELPERLTTIGRQCFLNAFAKEMDAVIPASVTTIGLEAFYTDQIHHVVVLAQDLSGYDGSAFRRSNYDERIIILPNAVSYKEYVTKGTTSSMRDAMSYPYTAKFESGGTVVQTTCNHLYGQTLDTQFDPATNTVSVNDSYALPAVVPPAGGWEPGYTGGWTFDNRIILTSQSVVNYYTYERDKCEDTITFVLQPIVAPPTVVPIVDGQPVEDGSLNVTVPDNGTHRIGVQVTHPLEQEPANPVDGDVYVDFRYKWTDVAGSFQGPRSGGDGHGGVAGWPDKEFNSWSWDYNTIPIEGTEHARSGENYYMVEIEGYYTRYDAATGKWSSGVLFFKTASTIFGGAGEETNYYPPYCFRVDVEEDPNYQRYQVQVGKTGEGTVTVSPQKTEYDAGDELTLELKSTADTKIKSYSIRTAAGDPVSYSKGGGDGTTRQQLFLDMPASDVEIQVEFAPYSYAIDVNADGTDPDVIDFGTVEEGYTSAPAARKLYVDNLGDRTVHITLPTASGYRVEPGEAYGWSGGTGTVHPSDYVLISIRPEEGLPVGTYDRTITITTDQGTSDTISVRFSVVKESYSLTVENGTGGGRYPEGQQVSIQADAAPAGKVFDQWVSSAGGTFADACSAVTSFTMPASDVTVTAVYRDAPAPVAPSGGGNSDGSSGTDSDYTIHYNTNGGEKLLSETRSSSWTKSYEDLPVPVRESYVFAGWHFDGGLTDLVEDDVRVNRSAITLYAKWDKDLTHSDHNGVSSWLNTREHDAYLSGYGNGTFGPDRNMTRGEVAQMFYNLLLDQEIPAAGSFTDVPEDAWCAEAVNTLAALGIIQGVGDNQFLPDRPITRAEFVVIAARFTRLEVSGENIFSDVDPEDWFYDQMVRAVQFGWIAGYEDGTFRPDQPITRAEVTVIMNRMLGRTADEEFADAHAEELRQFPDVPESHWAYYPILEAANSHDYIRDAERELWTDLL